MVIKIIPHAEDKSGVLLEHYEKYTVWLFYWWNFCSKYKNSLIDFRKTIVSNELIAEQNERQISSKAIIKMGKIIDNHKTW